MRFPLYSSRRLAASLALCCVVVGHCGAVGPAEAAAGLDHPSAPVQPVTLDFPENAGGLSLEERLIEEVLSREEDFEAPLVAHHGGEGAGGLSSLSAMASSASTTTTLKGGVATSAVSSSLWGNMLLNMAYQMDPEIRKIASRIGAVNNLTLLSIAGVSGLGLAQSVYSYRQIEPPLTVNVTEAHHHGGHDHVHMPPDSKVPSTLGMIGSGVTLATLGVNAVMNKRYSRKLRNRQLLIKEQVEGILAQLRENGPTEGLRQDLAALVGPLAADEFLVLWQVTHP